MFRPRAVLLVLAGFVERTKFRLGKAPGARMGNTDRRGPEISDGWQGTSDDGSGVDMSTGGAVRVAVVGAGVAGLGTSVCVP